MAKELAPGKMFRPSDIQVDFVGERVYVVEKFNHRVSKWDYVSGNYTFTLDVTWGSNADGTSGEPGPVVSTTDNFFDNPTGIAFDIIAQRLYVTDTNHNRVRVLNADTGAFITSIGQGGTGNTDFYRPAGIAINDSCSFFVVADEFNHRAVKYSTAATPAFQSVLPSPTPKPFNRPHGVSHDSTEDEFVISDSVTNVLSIYDLDAITFTTQIGTPSTTGADGLFFPSNGNGVSTGGALFFANTRSNQIKSKTGATTLANELTSAGTGDGQLYFPESCEVFTATVNYILVVNTLNNRVEAFDQTPAFQSSFGSP